jgi:hypothetical protein
MFATELDTPVDTLEQQLLDREAAIAQLRIQQAELLRALDTAQVAQTDGSRSMLEWTMARCDVTEDTSRDLLRVARLGAEHTSVVDDAADRGVSFDRVVETLRLAAAGADEDLLAYAAGCDLAGLRRLTGRRRRMTRSSENQAYHDRFMATQSTLDESSGRFWGQLPGYELRILEKAVDARADELRALPGPVLARGQARADALVAVAQDSLDGAPVDGPAPVSSDPIVTLFADLDLADTTRGEAGVEIEFGPKAGPATLERILCAGRVQLIGLQAGVPVVTSDARRAIPPAVRRFVAWRDGGCTIAGCRSRYRLQPHHIHERSHGGDHHPDNLTTLCWYHHHIVIHGLGYVLDPNTPPQARHFMLPTPKGPDPP